MLHFSVVLVTMTLMAQVVPKSRHPEVSYNQFNLHHTLLPQVGQLDVSNPDHANRMRWSVGCEMDHLVYVEPIMGKVHDLRSVITKGGKEGEKVRCSGLPMWDSPILLMKKSALKLK